MSWGDALKQALDKASAAGRAAADRIASGEEWVGQKSDQAARWLQQKKAEAAEWAAAKRKQAAEWVAAKREEAAEWAAEKRDAVKQSARQLQREKLDKAYDWAGEKAESKRVKDAAKRQKQCFPKDQKAGSPVQPCPKAKLDANQQHDGWMMAPKCLDTTCSCTPVPPGKTALADARSQSPLSDSKCCRAARARGEPTRDIIYVNGINTPMDAHCATLKAIAAQTCGRVVGIYNATEGFAADAAQTSQDRRLIKQAMGGGPVPTGDGRNPAVDTLQRQITNELRAGRKPEIWAHSQGGAVTSLALHAIAADRAIAKGATNALEGIKVKSMGAAAPKWPDGATYEHYIHVNDFTPSNFGLGFDPAGDAAAAGRAARMIRFSGDPASGLPFSTKPKLDMFPASTSNHGVEDTYLKMEKQVHGGCP